MTKKTAVVIGAGVIGLTTGIEAQAQGFDVVLYTVELPLETTSAKAGASFKPHEVAGMSQNQLMLERSKEHFEKIVSDHGHESGVRRHIHWEASSNERQTPDYLSVMSDVELLGRPDVPGGYEFGWKYETFFIDTPVHLMWLASQFQASGGSLILLPRPFEGLEQLAALEADVVFNCTGLGARRLCNDNAMIPIRGQIVVTDPTPEMDWSISADGFYVYPRLRETILGGTAEWHMEDETVDSGAIHLIIRGNKRILPHLTFESARNAYAGLRPYREGSIRLESEELNGRTIVHNYGHGGSGFTLSWGSARQALALC